MSKVRRSVTIEPEHQEWLDENEHVNLSGLVRQSIDEKMNEQAGLEPFVGDSDE